MRLAAATALGFLALPVKASEAISNDQLATMVASLLFVLAVIGVLAYLAKRFNFSGPTSGQMKLVAMLPLGTKEKLAVVQVGEQQYLVGVTPQNIRMLDKLATPLNDNSVPQFGPLLRRLKQHSEKES